MHEMYYQVEGLSLSFRCKNISMIVIIRLLLNQGAQSTDDFTCAFTHMIVFGFNLFLDKLGYLVPYQFFGLISASSKDCSYPVRFITKSTPM